MQHLGMFAREDFLDFYGFLVGLARAGRVTASALQNSQIVVASGKLYSVLQHLGMLAHEGLEKFDRAAVGFCASGVIAQKLFDTSYIKGRIGQRFAHLRISRALFGQVFIIFQRLFEQLLAQGFQPRFIEQRRLTDQRERLVHGLVGFVKIALRFDFALPGQKPGTARATREYGHHECQTPRIASTTPLFMQLRFLLGLPARLFVFPALLLGPARCRNPLNHIRIDQGPHAREQVFGPFQQWPGG